MKEYLTSLVQPFLENPQALTIVESEDEQGKLLSVQVSRKDMGRVIGKSGQTINCIRILSHLVGIRKGESVAIKILEPTL